MLNEYKPKVEFQIFAYCWAREVVIGMICRNLFRIMTISIINHSWLKCAVTVCISCCKPAGLLKPLIVYSRTVTCSAHRAGKLVAVNDW